MPVIDLTRYIVAKAGTWTDPKRDQNLFDFTLADTMSPGRLMLRWADDFVALTGPVRVRVTVQAENMTVPLGYLGSMIPDSGAAWGRLEDDGTAEQLETESTSSAVNEITARRLLKSRGSNPQFSTIYSYVLDVPAGQAWPYSLSEHTGRLETPYLNSADRKSVV